MKVDVYNAKNEKVEQMEVSDQIFARPWNADLVHQVLSVQVANRRRVLAHAKTRAEVSGGGRKPWRQKGTGRARHGSIRSPLWRGGGVTFGPTKERNFSKKINRKMVRGAIHAVLSKKLQEGELKVLESVPLAQAKTKYLGQLLRALQSANALVVTAPDNKTIIRAVANLPKTKSISPQSLNVYDLLRYKNVLIEKEAIPGIK